MDEKFAVDGAICMCAFGTTPGKMRVTDQDFTHINGSSLAGTSMNLGNVFYPPGFTVCKASWPSRPCTANVVAWSDTFTKVKVNGVATLLTSRSKATCALGVPGCIRFVNHGQIPMPATLSAHPLAEQLDPTGEELINGQPLRCLEKVKTKLQQR